MKYFDINLNLSEDDIALRDAATAVCRKVKCGRWPKNSIT